MKHALILLVLVACGDKKSVKDAPAVPKDAAIDALVDAMLPACADPVAGETVSFRKLTGEVVGPATLATSPPLDLRLFVLEQRGAIRIYKDEVLQPDPFLDLSQDNGGTVVAGQELGLLGLAFHPSYATTGQFFIYYTTRVPNDALRDVLARCTVSADPDRANPTCVEVLSIDDPQPNHNGGMLEFGTDGFLYISTGDGGGTGDPQRTSQNPSMLFGKILRIDVNAKAAGKEYGIPPGNPFAAGGGAPEIFVLGLRNPWRWSFDRGTGDMWIGDVGQVEFEELTVLKAGQQAGKNLGWSAYEANRCCANNDNSCVQILPLYPCEPNDKVFPHDVRTHASGWVSIIAGQTYRGTCFPDLVGWHFYTDFGAADLVKARLVGDTFEKIDLATTVPVAPSSIHADARGELYLTTAPQNGSNGAVYRLQAGP